MSASGLDGDRIRRQAKGSEDTLFVHKILRTSALDSGRITVPTLQVVHIDGTSTDSAFYILQKLSAHEALELQTGGP